MAASAKGEPLNEKEVKNLRDAFQIFDLNHDKSLDAAELGVILKSINRDFKTGDVHRILAEAGTRTVTFEQLVKIVEKTRSVFSIFELDELDRRIKEVQGAAAFSTALDKYFPGALLESLFINELYQFCAKMGFTKENTIAAVSTCRDEICKPLSEHFAKHWVGAFDLTSLAGMVFLGTTGMSAALHHAPEINGKERYLFLAAPHIAVDSFGEVGSIYRAGRTKKSNACGALCAFRSELESGKLKTGLDMDDLEYSLMKQRLIDHMEYGSIPSLVDLTKVAMKVIQEDLERLIKAKVNTKDADYVVCIGVQVHGPHWMKRNVDIDYFWPHETYAVVDGKRQNYKFEGPRKSKAHSEPTLFNPFVVDKKQDKAAPVDQAFERLASPKEQKISKEAALEFAAAASVPKDKLSKVTMEPYLGKTEFAELVKKLGISDEDIEKALKKQK